MQKFALGKEGALNPYVRSWALEATANCADRDDRAQATAIFNAVKLNIRFRGEYSETVQSPLVTLQLGAGDCDDHSTLIVALLRSIGIPGRFKTVATDPTDPRRNFTHVYALAGLRRGNHIAEWLPLDTTVPYAVAGWEAPRVTRSKVWGGMEGMYLGDDPQLSQQAQNTVAVINSVGQAGSQLVSSFRNTKNTTTFSAAKTPNGVVGNVGTSATTLAIAGVGGAALLLLLMRKHK
jgi:transglutaminase-like putative cysteine protease